MMISLFQVVFRTTRSYVNHSHGDYEFHYVCRGSCFFERNGRINEIKNGTFLYFSPGESHHIIIKDPSIAMTHYSFHLTLEKNDNDLRDLLENRILNKTLNVGYNKRIFFEEVRSRIENNLPDQRTAGHYQLLSFLYQLPEQQKGQGQSSFKDDRISGEIESLLHIMQNQVYGIVDLNRLIKNTNYSESYFMRRFKAVTGLPPNQYYLRLKIETAKVLLLESEETIKSISEKLIFTDEFYFSRTFKKWTGKSPKDWRNRGKKI